MKSELDARPIYLQRWSTITGHLLVCYLAVLLMSLLQVKVLGDRFCSEDLMGLFRGLNDCQASDRRHVCERVALHPGYLGACGEDRAPVAHLVYDECKRQK